MIAPYLDTQRRAPRTPPTAPTILGNHCPDPADPGRMALTKVSECGRFVVVDALHIDRDIFDALARWAADRGLQIQDAIQRHLRWPVQQIDAECEERCMLRYPLIDEPAEAQRVSGIAKEVVPIQIRPPYRCNFDMLPGARPKRLTGSEASTQYGAVIVFE